MRKRRINQEFLDLLASGRLNDFTVSELKTAYMSLPNCAHRSEKAAWQFVYRNVLRLEERGQLSRLVGESGGKTRYQVMRQGDATTTVSRVPLSTVGALDEATQDTTLRCLKERLHRYNVEMLSAIGETEEYDAICTEHPHMRSTVQTLYNEARDRCSKTLGRVRALESLLSNHQKFQPL